MFRRGLVGLTAAAAIGAVVASSATGGIGPVPPQDLGTQRGLNYRVGHYSSFQAEDIYATVACAATAKVVGGGVDATGRPAASRLETSRGGDDESDVDFFQDDLWIGEAQGQSAAAKTFHVYAICRNSSGPELTYRGVQIGQGPGEVSQVRIACDPGTSVVGGGPNAQDANIVRSAPFDGSDANKRPDDGWVVKGKNVLDISHNLGVLATCLENGNGPIKYASAKRRVPAKSSRRVTVDCPNDTAVAGGGATFAAPPSKAFLHALTPRDDGDTNSVPDDRYQAVPVNRTGKAKRATAHAVCLS